MYCIVSMRHNSHYKSGYNDTSQTDQNKAQLTNWYKEKTSQEIFYWLNDKFYLLR